jgi:hypothetical protein
LLTLACAAAGVADTRAIVCWVAFGILISWAKLLSAHRFARGLAS